uniref:Major surface glycoprotein n=1 Tax=Caenorhabditis tropicalis TaxID=1561998 RepID=A0A1I7U8C6_9PELO
MLRTFVLLSTVAILSTWAVKCKYEGTDMDNNEIITVQKAFRIKCMTEDNGSWKTEIIGCIAPDGAEIGVGLKRETGDKIHECVKSESGQVSLKESKGIKAACPGGQKNGEEWQEKSFKFRCGDGGVVKFIACVGQDGSIIKSGETGKIGGFDVKCEQHANGTITMQAANDPKSYDCKAKDGSSKKNGEEYVEGNFVRKCGDYGQGKIVGCHAENVATTIPINQNVTSGDVVFSCTKEGSNYSFKTYSLKSPVVYSMCAHEGKQYTNGTTFISQGSFRMRCVTFKNLTSTLEVVSCITPAGVEIAIGSQLEEGDKVYECTSGNVTLKSTPGQSGKCRGTYSVGEEWIEDSFKLTCEPYGKVNLKSCFSKEGTEIPLGEARRVPAGYAMECVIVNGNVALQTAKNFDCLTGSGENKKMGETWNEGNFVRRCANYGVSSIIGCYVDGVGTFGLNQNITSGSLLYMCINENEQFKFRTLRAQ